MATATLGMFRAAGDIAHMQANFIEDTTRIWSAWLNDQQQTFNSLSQSIADSWGKTWQAAQERTTRATQEAVRPYREAAE